MLSEFKFASMFVRLFDASNMENTLFVGNVCHRFDQLPSTNDYAKELLANGNPSEGTMVITANQTAGRGQFGRQWLSTPNASLTASFILYPSFLPAAQIHLLSQGMALAVYDTLQSHVDPSRVHIKWPNDMYIDNEKVAGLLIETTLSTSGRLVNSVIGIGINCNQIDFDSALPPTTSLFLATGQLFPIEQIAETLAQQIQTRYLQIKAGQYTTILEDYQTHLFGQDQFMQYAKLHDLSLFWAKVIGVDTGGLLILEHSDGSMQAYQHGECRLVR
jgi:BirA family transcriptional regulator, biotin operon repressor / biotin---[acetyl-CoA-carboxylase] ligase